MKKQLFLSLVLLVTAVEVFSVTRRGGSPTANPGPKHPGSGGGNGGGNGGGDNHHKQNNGQSTPPGAASKIVNDYSADLKDLLAGALHASGVDTSNPDTTSAAYKAGEKFVQTGLAQ